MSLAGWLTDIGQHGKAIIAQALKGGHDQNGGEGEHEVGKRSRHAQRRVL